LGSDHTCLEITWANEGLPVSHLHFEPECVHNFVHGHPDYPTAHGFGRIPDEGTIQLLPCAFEDREIIACLKVIEEHGGG
jgi:hypothetical protein